MLPAAAGEPQKDEDIRWQALKKYIIRARQRHKQEVEADAEQIRQRREREQKHKQDVMTLGEMKEQQKEYQTRLASLTETKHQLFLSLKKVLNEDDNRRRQAVRESAGDMINVAGSYPQGLGAGAIFLQPIQRLPMYKVSPASASGPHPGAQGPGPLPVQGASLASGPSGTKRPRSPSPPPPGYHPYNNYKTSPSLFPTSSASSASSVASPYATQSSVASPSSGSQHGKSVQMQHPHPNPPQHPQDESRRNHEYPRAVLWNKGAAPPFVNVYGGVYGVAPSGPVYSYASAPPGTYEQVYTSRQSYDGKPEAEKLYLRGPAGPLQMGVHSPHAPKAAITTAFPVRPTHQHSAYLTPGGSSSARLLYGSTHSTATVQSPAARYQSSGAL